MGSEAWRAHQGTRIMEGGKSGDRKLENPFRRPNVFGGSTVMRETQCFWREHRKPRGAQSGTTEMG